jgi:hypothetical protein
MVPPLRLHNVTDGMTLTQSVSEASQFFSGKPFCMTDIKYLSIVGQDLEYNLMFNRFCMPEYTSILCERDSHLIIMIPFCSCYRDRRISLGVLRASVGEH